MMHLRDLLAIQSIVGRDIKSIDCGVMTRGPISKVSCERNGVVVIKLAWNARFLTGGDWERDRFSCKEIRLPLDWQAFERFEQDGSIELQLGASCFKTILSEGDRLDPAKVKNLTGEELAADAALLAGKYQTQ